MIIDHALAKFLVWQYLSLTVELAIDSNVKTEI